MEKKTIWHAPGMPEPDRWIYEKPSKKHPRGCCYYHHAMEPFTTDAEYAYIDDLISIIKALDVARDMYLKKCEELGIWCCPSEDDAEALERNKRAFRKVGEVEFDKAISEIIGGK